MDDDDHSFLIRAVRDEKVIYQKNYPGYNDRSERHNAWTRVAKIVGRSIWDCEKRWRLLREKYARERKALNSDPLDSDATSSWPYFEAMSFVTDCLKRPRSPTSIFETADNEYERGGTSAAAIAIPPPPVPVKKVKTERDEVVGALKNAIQSFTAKVKAAESEDDIFARSIVSLMRPLTPSSKDFVKQKIYNIIFDARKHALED